MTAFVPHPHPGRRIGIPHRGLGLHHGFLGGGRLLVLLIIVLVVILVIWLRNRRT